MKCPKCGQEIDDNVKFCTKCGANIEEEKKRIEEKERKEKEEEEKRKKAIEDKKRLDEIRKEEERRRLEEQKEAEKAEIIRRAKEEGIELEIIDEKNEEVEKKKEEPKSDFKVKKDKPEKTKKKKVKIKKNIFQVFFGKLIFLIVVCALMIGGVYYCYKQNLLPDFAKERVEKFDHTAQNVIKLYKDVEEGKKNLPEVSESKENWMVEPNISADDIRDLNNDVSVIVKDKKEGLIDNKTGEVVLEPKYTQILLSDYYDIDKTEAEKESGIVVKDIEKIYKLDSDYNISTEVNLITKASNGTYYFDHHGPDVYFNNSDNVCALLKPSAESSDLKLCTDIDIITTEGVAAKDTDLPESFSIDFSKSKVMTKGYVDLKTAELKINCDYDDAYEFSDGYAAVKKGTKAGIIDEDGKEVVETKYQETRSVHDGAAFVKKDGKWGALKVSE